MGKVQAYFGLNGVYNADEIEKAKKLLATSKKKREERARFIEARISILLKELEQLRKMGLRNGFYAEKR